ncbi:non-receptor serine/threonine protein kinase [Lithospermum erythrorhizon]|uniref:cyclin-dependent kinase n=1 Tax=Lithospermum erythrorhizon TaxID=34254 RepID=A0AAV3QHV9_LITER
MAARTNGDYRVEFKDQERELKVSRREVGRKMGVGHGNFWNGNSRDYDRGRENGDIDNRGRINQKDVKERDAVMSDGHRYLWSSRSHLGISGGGSGPKKRGVGVVASDREPGELSSESSSDGDIGSESNGVRNFENANKSPVQSKKRKFLPIIWDREDKRVSGELKTAASTLPPPPPLPKSLEICKLASTLPPPPPVHKSFETSKVFLYEGLDMYPSPNKVSKLEPPAPLSQKPMMELDSHVSEAAAYLSGQSSPCVWEEYASKNDQAEDVEHEEYISRRDIGSSRWANDAYSSADEGEIYIDAKIPNPNKKRKLNSVETIGSGKAEKPELGELKREGPLGVRLMPSESDEPVRYSGRYNYSTTDVDKNEYMEIYEDQYNCAVSSQSDKESNDERFSDGTPEPPPPPQRNVNMLQGCRSVDVFERLNAINEGTYGVVYRARDRKTGETVALKKVKMEKEREGFPLTALREMNILLSINHPSIVDVKEVVMGKSLDSIFMVMEYMEHDLKGLMETMKHPFSQSEVKCLMLQLLDGTKYLHDNWVLHRDLKTSNILLNNCGELKICDFGLARQYGSPLKPYTQLVVTLWYRAPELLLGAKQYSTSIDMWSLGCIMAELLSKKPLFNGKSEIEQIDKIFRTLGTPNETIWPGYSKLPGVKANFVKNESNLLRKKFPPTSFTWSPVLSDAGFDLLNKLLTYDPESRITVEAALDHQWFREVPLPKAKEFMPTFPAQHVQDRRIRRVMKSPDPLEEQRRRELQVGGSRTGGVFG